jgi:hypothetical protein
MGCFALKHYPESPPKAWYARKKWLAMLFSTNVLPKCNSIIDGRRSRSSEFRRFAVIERLDQQAANNTPVAWRVLDRARLVRGLRAGDLPRRTAQDARTVAGVQGRAWGRTRSRREITEEDASEQPLRLRVGLPLDPLDS